jgi:hypothetical protein
MACPNLKTCPFFHDKLKNMPSTANMLKKKYCEGNYQECARWMVFKACGKEKVPPDLFPNQTERAKKIIAAKV